MRILQPDTAKVRLPTEAGSSRKRGVHSELDTFHQAGIRFRARPALPSFVVPRIRERPVNKPRLHARVLLGLCVLAAVAAIALPSRSAHAQACPETPENPSFWVQCGVCRGDLNSDGLLDGLDLMVFELYADQFPQNLCADFNDTGVVDVFDEQVLRCLITESDGTCTAECGPSSPRDCFTAAIPGAADPGGCNDPSCCQRVCEADPACCSTIWDVSCVGFANNLCDATSPDVAPDAGDCLCEHLWPLAATDCLTTSGFPGCSDQNCSEIVCFTRPSCCEIRWDADCASLAAEFCQSPCSNLKLRRKVCELDASCCLPDLVDGEVVGNWDEGCATLAALVILNEPGLQIKYFPANGLLCNPGTQTKKNPRPIDAQLAKVQQLLCAINPVYCAPAGNTTFDQNISECLARLSANYPECAVLYAEGGWDEACIQIADQLCRWPEPLSTGLGNCLLPHAGGGCSNGLCNDLVCRLDPTCCTNAWDTQCAELAAAQCVLVPAEVLGQPDVEARGSTQVANEFVQIGCGSSNAGACCYENFTPYCEDGACCQLVCGYDDYCCDVRWDEFCAQLATAGCTTLADVCTCGFKPIQFGPLNRSCFEARDPDIDYQYVSGCSDADCCNTVCYVDPYCCEVRWDGACAEGALQLCSPFDDLFPDCGNPFAGSCFVPKDTPNCDETSCCQNVCEIDPACCTQAWDEDCVDLARTECVQCGDIFSGSCLSPGGLPGCADEECCESVCEIDIFCCEVQWDGACVGAARFLDDCKLTGNCGLETGRSCFLENYLPGCSNATCCTTICTEYDPYCCEAKWDAICASQALSFCLTPLPGGSREPCDSPHGTPGCNDENCAIRVCSIPGLEYCCEARWDADCVQAASSICPGLYICPGEGDCKTPHANPLCDDPACCNVVCTYDPACCRVEWDNECAVLALQNCTKSGSTSDFNCPCEGSCFEARSEDDPRPGCEDSTCCIAVCRIDEACCIDSWDESCATLARVFCGAPLECGSSITGSCVRSHDNPFCDDAVCCQSICAIDPFCCSDRWDSFCVNYAIDRCQRGCGVETAGSCFYPHPTPGCSDADCCAAVCEVDPVCCASVWDATCATEALGDPNATPPTPGLCDAPQCGDFAAGSPCEINFSPASNDKRCCQAVCALDPICCDTTWDLECVRLARTVPTCPCGADWECGDPCAGDCCVANFTPKCNDEDCCNAVCLQDNFCCDTEWDLVCASMANQTDACRGPRDACPAPQCGDEDAGSCCFPNGTPACNSDSCCTIVCALDPICCDVSWDDVCADSARTACPDLCDAGLECGDLQTGPCDEPNASPFCRDQKICECVCLFEPFCCIGEWDETCVFIATELCP